MENTPGQDAQSGYSHHFTARLADFMNPKTPWSRRLWDLGPFLALEELYDVGTWLDRQVLSVGAVKWLQHSLEVQLGNDVAFGTPDLRRQLGQALRSDLTIRSEGRKRLRHVIDTARAGYLERWQSRVASPNPPGPERAARAAAAHLLDAGHSQVALRRWLTGHAGLSAVDLMSEAAVLSVLPPQTFRVWVPVLQLANIEKLADHLPAFSRAEQLEPNIKAELANLAPKGFVGAFAYEVEARDAERAVELVVEVVERMRARSRFAGAPGLWRPPFLAPGRRWKPCSRMPRTAIRRRGKSSRRCMLRA